jgi:acyl-CoA synthetase (AMP-forming)/AMP-acid ligase II
MTFFHFTHQHCLLASAQSIGPDSLQAHGHLRRPDPSGNETGLVSIHCSLSHALKETLEFFNALDMQVMELYGMSECTGPTSTNTPWGEFLIR